jgi:hypothetical protein
MIGESPFDGSLYIFRGKRGDYFKAIYWDGTALWLLAKRLCQHLRQQVQPDRNIGSVTRSSGC